MKNNMLKIIAVTLIILAAFAIVLNSQNQQNDKIKIGAIFMLSGVGSNWGENSQKGSDMAVEDINKAGGINGKMLEIIYEDNSGDSPTEAVKSLEKLMSDGIKIILGPNWSPSGNAVAPIACDNKIIMISPSLGVADFNEKCDYLFNLWPHDDVLSRRLGGYLYEKGHRKAAVLGSLQAWENVQANAVKKGFENAGGSVVSFQLTQNDEKDFRAEALKIKESSPDAVVFTNYAYEHLAAKRLREIGVNVIFFSVLMDDDRIKGAEGAFENAIVITSFTPSEMFVERFADKHKTQPDIGSDTSYDAVMLIGKAMEETNTTDTESIKNYLNSLKTYEGISGSLVFDGKGGVMKEPRFMTVKNNTLVDLPE